ncbi:ribosomal protein L3 [Anaeromyxobacter sp. K]|uniref:Large ribosomal subunit protein uL3 n=2 Tax=Anaeromyxobacter TaxID=161492 RepID=RL3_ANAD2|nr:MULTISPECIES: 50S ribosomal protein L3 [Anaeromyxobacter]B4UAM2.1 RecName: Full=Large ribosomal subunit protein uL3; AltName: Full=50S ribosomal protein L3 [Anaeromyxobacter sp. K]B8J817.1 RecName: Full=Large ribosomal subunit protein uL3; AltName: Full=50S ribosomal protein L3 [Anaeromyxobacter dehalogenans 2CP-1]ACG73118.1 ribosomal protein L3 [Anaeromyxobacter sp. K]ACL65316.1 ribosomal protein L3 [Anaeromyxobacter dehalogenans 2CP-1]
MSTGLLAKKVGMTQIFTPEGDCVPVTVLEAGPCTVVRRKTAEKDGYDAVVIGFGVVDEKHAHRLSKPEVGVFKKAGTPIFRHVKEIRVKDAKQLGDLKAGDVLTVDKVFKANQRIDVAGVTKGRGFTGVMKRWNMKGAARDSSTAHEHHRHVGAIGQRKTPGKVWKGKHLPGHYGVDNVTIQNLTVVGIEAEQNVLLVSGAVPGHADGLLFVNTAAKGQPRIKQKQEVRERAKPKV